MERPVEYSVNEGGNVIYACIGVVAALVIGFMFMRKGA